MWNTCLRLTTDISFVRFGVVGIAWHAGKRWRVCVVELMSAADRSNRRAAGVINHRKDTDGVSRIVETFPRNNESQLSHPQHQRHPTPMGTI